MLDVVLVFVNLKLRSLVISCSNVSSLLSMFCCAQQRQNMGSYQPNAENVPVQSAQITRCESRPYNRGPFAGTQHQGDCPEGRAAIDGW